MKEEWRHIGQGQDSAPCLHNSMDCGGRLTPAAPDGILPPASLALYRRRDRAQAIGRCGSHHLLVRGRLKTASWLRAAAKPVDLRCAAPTDPGDSPASRALPTAFSLALGPTERVLRRPLTRNRRKTTPQTQLQQIVHKSKYKTQSGPYLG